MKTNTLRRFAVAALPILFAATGAHAAPCSDRGEVIDRLGQMFNETLIANTISPSRNVLEVYASPNAATWSVIVTLPGRNLACLAASGKGHDALRAYLPTS